jgi:predicted negative regulator of RcsB-dependent stress response
MAEDYLTDDEQLESLKRWFSENGIWLLGGAILGIALLYGWRYYQSYSNQQGLQAAAQFDALGAALNRNERDAAVKLAESLKRDYSRTPYADQAELVLARLFIEQGELGNAVDPLTRVMNESHDSELRYIARVRLARVLLDQDKPDETFALLAAVPPTDAFSARYHELRGDAYIAKKDTGAAMNEYQAALNDKDPRGVDRSLLGLKLADLGPIQPKPAIVKKAAP